MQPAGVQATPAHEVAQTDGMKPVDIFCWIDRLQDTLCVDLGGERELDENAIHGVVTVEILDEFEHLSGCDAGGRSVQPASEAELFARGDLALDVELRCGIFANQNSGKAGTNAR
jgi:hypothetical protein